MSIQEEIKLAIDNIKLAYTPYSNFKVSAVLIGEDNQVYTGVNIENASYTPTNCAERTAFFKAVSQGNKRFKRIIIVGGKDGTIEDYIAPCGVCRQVMMEFCDPESFEIILAKNENDYKIYKLKELLPIGFGPNNL